MFMTDNTVKYKVFVKQYMYLHAILDISGVSNLQVFKQPKRLHEITLLIVTYDMYFISYY